MKKERREVTVDCFFKYYLKWESHLWHVWCTIEKNYIPFNQGARRSVHVVPRKLELDQTTVNGLHQYVWYTETHKCDQTHFLVANFYPDDSDDICDPE